MAQTGEQRWQEQGLSHSAAPFPCEVSVHQKPMLAWYIASLGQGHQEAVTESLDNRGEGVPCSNVLWSPAQLSHP